MGYYRSLLCLMICIVLSGMHHSAKAQLSVGFDAGFTLPADQFHLPEGYQHIGLFIDPRPGFFGTVTGQYDWNDISIYGAMGWMYYRTDEGIGPFLHGPGTILESPVYEQFQRWSGTYAEIGLRKTIAYHRFANVEAGLGFSYITNYDKIDKAFPDITQGWLEMDRVVRFEAEITRYTAHSFVVSPHIRFWRETRNKDRFWLKIQYSHGLNTIADGRYDVSLLDFDNNAVEAFSFDVLLRHSFWNCTIGYSIFPAKLKDKRFWYPE